jgi:hypothetical protein
MTVRTITCPLRLPLSLKAAVEKLSRRDGTSTARAASRLGRTMRCRPISPGSTRTERTRTESKSRAVPLPACAGPHPDPPPSAAGGGGEMPTPPLLTLPRRRWGRVGVGAAQEGGNQLAS